MSLRGLVPEEIRIPLAFGLQQKNDPRSLELPALTTCKDVEFDEIGGLQTRHPFSELSLTVLGSGTAIADMRRLYENGPELMLFTKKRLYSRMSGTSTWVDKGLHLAVKTAEETSMAMNGDQLDCDRAELAGTIVYTFTNGTKVYVGAKDKATGATMVPPTAISHGSGTGTRPRLVALATKILLFWHNGTDGSPASLLCIAIGAATVASDIQAAATTVLASPNFGSYYDVCKIDGLDQAVFACRRVTTTSYTVGTVTAGLVVATSTKARDCEQAIAVASVPGGLRALVIYTDSGSIGGDFITLSTLADVSTATVIGSYSAQLNQLTGAFRSVKDDSVHRCYVFWSFNEDAGGTNWQSSVNWINESAATGTEAVFVRRLGIASRAFDYDGSVYVWTAFAGTSSFTGANDARFRAQLQNSYFLYKEENLDPPFLVAKAAFQRAGGFAPSIGRLPGVALVEGTTGFAWCGAERRIIAFGPTKQTGYGARAPRDITFTFDSNEARRCARIGSTVYITGGEVLQYDGTGLFEVGFHVYPWYFGISQGIGGSVPNGEYAHKLSSRWDNAKGERERSTTATVASFTIAAGPASFAISVVPLYVTHKTARPPACEIWRTILNPTPDSPFYLTTGLDPNVTSGSNSYRANSTTVSTLTAFSDVLVDTDLVTKESHEETGTVLENLAPPAATIMVASATRLFLAGVAGDPDRVWYSKLRNEGQVAAFHDALTFSVPRAGGKITGLAFLNETPIVFRETAIYAVAGEGIDNGSGGQNYEARRLPGNVGAVSQESILETSAGVVFKSSKGWHLLPSGFGAVEYIGSPIADYESETVVAIHELERKHQIRCLTTSRVLVFDTLVKQWAEWTLADGAHAALFGGTYHYITEDAVYSERSDYTGLNFGFDIETAPIPLTQIQGFGRVWQVLLLGEYQGPGGIRVRLARNDVASYFQDKTWPPDDYTAPDVGDALELEHRPSIQEMRSLKIRLTATSVLVEVEGEDVATWSPTKLTSLALRVGLERGLKPQPASVRQ